MFDRNASLDDQRLVLAKYVPALSGAVGGRAVLGNGEDHDLNSSEYRNGWGSGSPDRHHSDMKDMAYFYGSSGISVGLFWYSERPIWYADAKEHRVLSRAASSFGATVHTSVKGRSARPSPRAEGGAGTSRAGPDGRDTRDEDLAVVGDGAAGGGDWSKIGRLAARSTSDGEAIDRACVPDTGAASRTYLTRKDFGRRIRTRRQMSICGAVRRQARRPSADGRTVAPESGTPHRRHPGAPPHGLRTAPRKNRDRPGLGEGA